MAKTWKSLKRSDSLTCPRDGQLEKVLYVRKSGKDKLHVRTSRHDHLVSKDATL